MAAPFEEWYRSIPVVTRVYATACVLTTLAVHVDLVVPFDLYLNFSLVLSQFELWRLLTTFLFYDYIGLNFIFQMVFMLRHSKLLEESHYRGKTADFVYFYILGAVCLLLLDFLFYYTGVFTTIVFLAPSFSFMILYVWSKHNVGVQMSFLGLFTFTAPYLPWVILSITYLFYQHGLIVDVIGVIVGHIYYYLHDVYPEISGRNLLKTPHILKVLFEEAEAAPH